MSFDRSFQSGPFPDSAPHTPFPGPDGSCCPSLLPSGTQAPGNARAQRPSCPRRIPPCRSPQVLVETADRKVLLD